MQSLRDAVESGAEGRDDFAEGARALAARWLDATAGAELPMTLLAGAILQNAVLQTIARENPIEALEAVLEGLHDLAAEIASNALAAARDHGDEAA